MTLHAMAVLLVGWILPAREPESPDGELPRWERHPVEQRFQREQERNRANVWQHIPRSW